jgi:hypothetical protein
VTTHEGFFGDIDLDRRPRRTNDNRVRGPPLLLIALLALTAPVARGQFTFTTNNGGITITGYSGPGGDVVIPDATNGFPVVAIGTNAFFNRTNISNLTIPGSVAVIAYKAFTQCTGITNVTIGSGTLNLEDHAFYYCTSLVRVTIPASVTNISSGAFRYCFDLVTLALDPANAQYCIVDGVLFNHDQTTLVLHPAGFGTSYAIPPGVKHIADYALASCYALTNVFIPTGVETIGFMAFDNLFRLKTLALPDSITSVGRYAFEYCSGLTNLDLGHGVADLSDDAFNNCTALKTVSIPASVTNIGNNLFWYCTGLTNATLPDGIATLGNGLFLGCQSLSNAFIPDSVRDIGSNTFNNCSSLTRVTLGRGVTNIGISAFWNCSVLKTLTIPAGVLNINTQAFAYCSSLSNVFFAGNAPVIGTTVFQSATPVLYYLPNTTGWHTPFAGRPAVLWNPLIQTDAGFGIHGNRFEFNITGTTNIPVLVEAAADLAASGWVPLWSGRVTNGVTTVADPLAGNVRRYYRIRSP